MDHEEQVKMQILWYTLYIIHAYSYSFVIFLFSYVVGVCIRICLSRLVEMMKAPVDSDVGFP